MTTKPGSTSAPHTRPAADRVEKADAIATRCYQGLVTPARAAEALMVTPTALKYWRGRGGGPRFVRLSRKIIRYRVEDLEAFVDERIRANTTRNDR